MAEETAKSGEQVLNGLPFAVRRTENPRRVLIVEDRLDSVHVLAELIRDMGHRVEFAINGYAALRTAREFRPHFVLLDLGLPGMDGFEVCKRLKRDKDLGGARVVAITAYGRAEYRTRAMAAGCELYLVKPVNPQALFDLLDSSLPGPVRGR